MTITTSLVIPAYNEAQRLAAGYERLAPTLEVLGADETELIIVDDGSTDDTLHVANDVFGHLAHTRCIQQMPNRGKGAAVRLGIAAAQGDFVITSDADMSIHPHHFPEIVAQLAHCDVAPGSRVDEGHIDYDSRLRTLAGKSFNVLVRHYTGTKLRDTQCGCKGFRLGPARLLGLLGYFERFSYDAEMLYLADQLTLRVEPVTVTWDDVTGSSVHVLRDALNMVRDLRSLRRQRYENPVVALAPDASLEEVRQAQRGARLFGAVLARGASDSLLVLPRDGALGGLEIAAVLEGSLRTATLSELRGRSLEAV